IRSDRRAIERLDLLASRLVEVARGTDDIARRRVESLAEELRVHERLARATAVERVRVVRGIADDEEPGGERLARVVDEAAQAVLEPAHREHVAPEHGERIRQVRIDERRDSRTR